MDLKANLFSAYDRHARLQAIAAGGAAAAAAPGPITSGPGAAAMEAGSI